VFRSSDWGRTWAAGSVPIRHDSPAAGIFSLAFADTRHGIAVGGDYQNPAQAGGNIALTSDGGRTWRLPASGPAGFRSAVVPVSPRVFICVGTTGSDISKDGGRNWTHFDDGAFNAASFFSSREGWAAGPKGRIARFAPSTVQ
jgi:photosystem II stability/assembly factor-like uncharacterized protein